MCLGLEGSSLLPWWMHEDFRRCPWKRQGKPLRISPLNSTRFLGQVSVFGFFELRLAKAFLNVAVCYGHRGCLSQCPNSCKVRRSPFLWPQNRFSGKASERNRSMGIFCALLTFQAQLTSGLVINIMLSCPWLSGQEEVSYSTVQPVPSRGGGELWSFSSYKSPNSSEHTLFFLVVKFGFAGGFPVILLKRLSVDVGFPPVV